MTESNKKNSSLLSYKKVFYDKEINRYTESVFIAESEGNIYTLCQPFENFIQEGQRIRVGMCEFSFHDQTKHILTVVKT